MTLSHRQTLDLNRLFPETPAYLVTHHVNRQVPAVTPPADRLRTGYFGDLGNTVRPASLAEMVDLVGIDTRDVNDNWLTALPHYNCHWIVRRTRPWDSWKPFLKGFVAARCGAPVIVTADDGDAAHYLGDDYPFYARSLARRRPRDGDGDGGRRLRRPGLGPRPRHHGPGRRPLHRRPRLRRVPVDGRGGDRLSGSDPAKPDRPL